MVAASAVGLWIAAAVGARDIAVFVAYELGFVAAPGCLLYRVLAPADSIGKTLVFGWVLGYAVEVVAYLAASALGIRELYPFYPLLMAPLIPFAARRWRDRAKSEPGVTAASVWTGSIVGIVSLAYLGLAYFARTPLPWNVGKVTYDTDVPFSLSLAGEALHHWPMVDPNVSGLGLHYYVWAHLDLAATSFVTGLPLPLVLFRFAVVPLTLLVVAQLVIAGRIFTGRASVGALAALLLLLVGEVDLEPWYSFPFLGLLFTDVWLSPTFLFGLLFFVAAVAAIGERIKSEESLRAGWRRWLLVTILLVACAAAKPPTLPVLLGGLLVTLVWRRRTRARPDVNALAGFAAVAGVLLVFYAAIYRHSSFGLGLHPFGSFGSMGWVYDLRKSIGDPAGWPLGVLIGTLALFGPQLAGLAVLLKLRGRRLDEGRVFLLGLLLAGLGPFFLFHQGGNGQVYFSHYGLVGGTLLAAEGFVLLSSGWARGAVWRSAAAIATATAAAVILVVYGIVTRFSVPGPSLPALHAQGVMAVVVVAGIFVLVWRLSAPSGRSTPLLAALFAGATGLALLLWRLRWNSNLVDEGYELAGVLLCATALAAFVARGRRRRELAFALVVAAATVGALDTPLDQVPNAIDRLRSGAPFSNASGTGLDRGLYDGLSWIRDNTATDAVLAVNNYDEHNGSYHHATYFYYSAFAERRVFLEGWLFSAASWNILGENALSSGRSPFPDRVRLNRAVFDDADPAALRVLVREYGVRYLVDDKLQGHATRALRRLGRVAFSNPAVTIYAVGPARDRT